MIIFAIPLRAKETTKDWNNCVRRFNATIRSIFNQTNPEFKCLVACNDIPEMETTYDERLEFIKVDTAIPTEWVEMCRDKFWKLTVIAVRIHELLYASKTPEGGIYVMPVDADDLLNCNIASWCAANPDEYGAVSAEGYVWNESSSFFRTYKEMNTYCGSCNIIKMYLEDLPEELPVSPDLSLDKDTAGKLNTRYPIRYDHGKVVQIYEAQGKKFAALPFRSTVYVLGTGDNISSIYLEMQNQGESKKKFHPVAFLRKINIFKIKPLTRTVKRDFGML